MSTKHKQREASERTCAGCRETLAPESLERFILMDEELVHDLRKRAPGRGAWVMARRECLERALAGGFARSFKSRLEEKLQEGAGAFGGSRDPDYVLEQVRQNAFFATCMSV